MSNRGGHGDDGGGIEISFAGITDPRPVEKTTDEEGEVSKGDGGVVRKAGKGHLPDDEEAGRTGRTRAQDLIDDMNEDPADRRTAQDLIDERDEAYKEAISRATNPFGGDEEVVKESDDLDMPSAADWLSEAEKSDDEKLAEAIGEEVAKRMDLSEAESHPSDGEGVSFARLFEGKSEKASRVAKGVESYIRDGGSLSDSLDEVQRWASA